MTPPIRGDEGELFARHHDLVERVVARQVNASPDLIAEACAQAWAQLLRSQPDRDTVVAWLITVATREAWALARSERRETSLEELVGDSSGNILEVLPDPRSEIAVQLEAREALALIAALPDRQRQLMSRQVAGLSYDEIAAEAGQTRTAVNRHLNRAHRTVRDHRGGRI